jgi:hypothetical protein
MCKAFSCIITKDKKVFWKLNIDSHDEIIKEFKIDEKKDTIQFVRCEISPKNGSYLNPDKWVFKIDEDNIPIWFSPMHKEKVMISFRQWKKELYKILIKNKKIINPLKDIKFKGKISSEHILLLKTWDSVWDSVWGSVGGSVGGSVWNSVWGSVWGSVGGSVRDSVWGSVRGSVGGSVWGYIGSFFRLEREQWKYTEKIKTSDYPFQSVVDLWNIGLIPSFDGKIWRLHAGKKAKIIFEISKEDLIKYNVKGG